jgi:hypothetical protein
MTRLLPVVLASLLFAGAAHAEEPEPPPAPRRVQVRIRLQREREFADVFIERRGTWGYECRAPCSVDAVAGERGRIDFPGTSDEPLMFVVPSDGSEVHEIEVRRRGRGKLVGGLVAFGAGALSLALGMAIIRGAGQDDLFGEANGAVGRILLVLGGASGVTGAVLVVDRSTAPVLVPPSTRSSMTSALPPVLPFVWSTAF